MNINELSLEKIEKSAIVEHYNKQRKLLERRSTALFESISSITDKSTQKCLKNMHENFVVPYIRFITKNLALYEADLNNDQINQLFTGATQAAQQSGTNATSIGKLLPDNIKEKFFNELPKSDAGQVANFSDAATQAASQIQDPNAKQTAMQMISQGLKNPLSQKLILAAIGGAAAPMAGKVGMMFGGPAGAALAGGITGGLLAVASAKLQGQSWGAALKTGIGGALTGAAGGALGSMAGAAVSGAMDQLKGQQPTTGSDITPTTDQAGNVSHTEVEYTTHGNPMLPDAAYDTVKNADGSIQQTYNPEKFAEVLRTQYGIADATPQNADQLYRDYESKAIDQLRSSNTQTPATPTEQPPAALANAAPTDDPNLHGGDRLKAAGAVGAVGTMPQDIIQAKDELAKSLGFDDGQAHNVKVNPVTGDVTVDGNQYKADSITDDQRAIIHKMGQQYDLASMNPEERAAAIEKHKSTPRTPSPGFDDDDSTPSKPAAQPAAAQPAAAQNTEQPPAGGETIRDTAEMKYVPAKSYDEAIAFLKQHDPNLEFDPNTGKRIPDENKSTAFGTVLTKAPDGSNVLITNNPDKMQLPKNFTGTVQVAGEDFLAGGKYNVNQSIQYKDGQIIGGVAAKESISYDPKKYIDRELTFGIWKLRESIGAKRGGVQLTEAGVSGVTASIGQWLKTKGQNLVQKVTVDKLQQAWKKAGSPTDSEKIRKVLQDAGVDPAIIDQVYQTMGIVSTSAATTSTSTTSSVTTGTSTTSATSTAATTPMPTIQQINDSLKRLQLQQLEKIKLAIDTTIAQKSKPKPPRP